MLYQRTVPRRKETKIDAIAFFCFVCVTMYMTPDSDDAEFFSLKVLDLAQVRTLVY